MASFYTLAAFVLGTIIGSFLNALTFRFNTGMSMKGRSRCMSCSTTIAWFDLIPGLSYILLRGKCRACNSSISMQYPFIELLTGVLFGGIYWILGLTIESLLTAIIFSILVAIIVYDAKHKIIPNQFVYWFVFLSFLSTFVVGNTISKVFFETSNLYAGIGLYLFFAAFWFFSKGKWMGLGDAKLSLGIGIFLGVVGGISAIILGFWAGAIAGLLLLAIQKSKGWNMKSEIPFAPFLIVGMWIVFFFNINVFNIGL